MSLGSKLSMNNGKIENCYAIGEGCAIFADKDNEINISGGTIDSCNKSNCTNSDIHILNSGNKLYAHGGVINESVIAKNAPSDENYPTAIISSPITYTTSPGKSFEKGKFTTFNGKVSNILDINYGIFYNNLDNLGTINSNAKTITFMNDNDKYALEVLESDCFTAKPKDPTKNGYILTGWYEKDNNGNLKEEAFEFGNTLNQNIVLYPKWTNLEMIDGLNQTFKHGETKDLSFRSNDSYVNFQKVKVDGNIISEDKYEVSQGSIIVTLKNSYLNTLSEGNHTLSIVSTGGTATTNFTITRDNNNQSGNTNNGNTNNPSSGTNNGQGTPSNGTNNGENNPTLKPSTGDSNTGNTNNSTTDKTNTSDKNNVKTGDNTNIVIWTLGLLISLIGIVYYRRENA